MVTAEKDLRFGDPVWSSFKSAAIPVDIIQKDLRTDVVIIGAGISGAMMAETLTDAGFKVIIVDKRAPGHGSTLATTALLQYEIDQPLSKLIPKIGFDDAVRAWRRSKLCVEALAIKTKILNIRCDLKMEESLYISGDVLNVAGLQKEIEIRNQIGLQCEMLKRNQLKEQYGLEAAAALRSFHNYSANPYRLCTGYLQKAIDRGAKIYSPTAIKDISTSSRRVQLETSYGFIITARYAVFTTGYEVPDQLRDQSFKIYSTWAIATGKQASQKSRHLPLIWEASDPYLYLRSLKDGRVICGGEDETFSDEEKRNALCASKTKALQKKLKKLLPGLDTTVTYSWSGSFGVTPTGLPLIGPVPGLNNCFAVMAFGGNGITYSRMGAEIVRNFLTNKKDPDADLFSFRT